MHKIFFNNNVNLKNGYLLIIMLISIMLCNSSFANNVVNTKNIKDKKIIKTYSSKNISNNKKNSKSQKIVKKTETLKLKTNTAKQNLKPEQKIEASVVKSIQTNKINISNLNSTSQQKIKTSFIGFVKNIKVNNDNQKIKLQPKSISSSIIPVKNIKKTGLSSIKNIEPNEENSVEEIQSQQKINTTSEIPATFDSSSTIDLNVNDVNKQTLKINDAPKVIDGKPFQSDEKLQQAFTVQKQMDVEDIKALWQSTVEKNTIIKFALKKLSAPPEQRRIHSSIMARSLSSLISGVSILPSIFGADSILSSASSVTGSLANRIISSKTMPKEMPLTDTELIQLAKLVEDLQDKVIKDYYEYKSSIEALQACRQNLILQSNNYSEAIKSKNEISIIASSALYDKELLNEITLKQNIKLRRLELERLAGEKIVDNLKLGKISTFEQSNKTSSEVNKNEKIQ